METWRAFAPAGWVVPTVAARTAGARAGLALPGSWALLAFVDGEPAGHCAMLDTDIDEPRSTILWHLFVRPRWFGTGLAAHLHDAFVARAHALDFPFAWPATPAGTRAPAASTGAAGGRPTRCSRTRAGCRWPSMGGRSCRDRGAGAESGVDAGVRS